MLEIGGSRGYSTIWLAAGARVLGGRVVSLEQDPAKIEAWRENIAAAGLEEWAELVEGNAFETLRATEDVFDLVFLDAEKDDYEELFELARRLLEPGALVVADNVTSHAETLAAYSEARQSDSTLVSVTVPLDRGIELTSIVLGEAPSSDLSHETVQVAVGSRKKAIQSSWSGIVAIRCGSSSNGTPRARSSSQAASRSSTRK